MNGNYYVETRDIYIEMLQEAQKIEDRRLVCLIGKRLIELGQISPTQVQNGAVVPFPGVYAITNTLIPAPVPQPASFWPRFSLRHIFLVLTTYLVCLFGAILL